MNCRSNSFVLGVGHFGSHENCSCKDGFEPKKTIMEGAPAVLKRAALGYLVLKISTTNASVGPGRLLVCILFAVPTFSTLT